MKDNGKLVRMMRKMAQNTQYEYVKMQGELQETESRKD